MTYFIVFGIINFLIFIHELGHYLAARWMKIPLSRFSVGLGPKLWGFTRGETEYRISMIPIGGYVFPAVKDPNDFFQIPIRKRVVFLLGGPLANIVITVALFILLNVMKYGLTFTGIVVLPILQTLVILYDFVSVIPSLFERHEELSGVVGVVAQGGEYIGWNARRFVLFSIMISLNLAVFNLLPLPPLDGGRLVLCFLEKLSPKVLRFQVPLAIVGWALIIGLIIYVTVLDFGRFST